MILFIFPVIFIAGILFLILSMYTTKFSLTALILNAISLVAISPLALFLTGMASEASWYVQATPFAIGVVLPVLLLAFSISNRKNVQRKKKLATNIN